MKLSKQVVAFVIGGIVAVANPGHAAEQAIKTARARYARVNQDLQRCTVVKRDLTGYSTEGGSLRAYFLNSAPRKLVARFYGETGKATEEYYFWGNRLFFVLRSESRYDKPFGKVRSTTASRFYFANGKLIRWVDEKESVSTTLPPTQQREGELLRSARDLLARAEAAVASPAARRIRFRRGAKRVKVHGR